MMLDEINICCLILFLQYVLLEANESGYITFRLIRMKCGEVMLTATDGHM